MYWLRVQKDRKRHAISLKTNDLAEAIRKAARIRQTPVLTSGVILKHSIERFIKYMRSNDRWTRSTETSKGYVLLRFADWCGPVLPSSITKDQIMRYHVERVRARSPRTAYGNIMTVRSFFNFARDIEKSVRDNPCAGLNLRAPAAVGRKDFCSPELVEKLITNCEREDLKFILFCGFHAGLRVQEIVEARPNWFDLKAQILHLRKTETIQFKDREERSIPLTGKFVAFLRDEYGLREPFMLHPEKRHGKNRYRYDPSRPFKQFMTDQECAWVTPHTMRHTFASLLASADVSVFKIATYLGDDVRVVQRHYAKLLPEVGALDSAFQLAPPSSSKPRQRSRAASSSKRS